MFKDAPEFRQYLDSAAWEHFCTLSRQIADFPRHLSIHVGGMIVSSKPISEMVPLERARAEGRVVCQWDKDGVDDGGLIKVDLLGLRMLSLIDEALRLVKATRGIELDLGRLPEDDPLVYDMIGRADTVGVFQVESRAQMQSLPRVRRAPSKTWASKWPSYGPDPFRATWCIPTCEGGTMRSRSPISTPCSSLS